MTVQAHAATSQANSVPPVSFLWLEITGRFGLQCAHCYAASGPAGTHGIMTAADWRSVISQAAVGGVSMAQLIGGEPTQHPAFADLLLHALANGLAVEVYTNLTHVKDSWWNLFAFPGVSLATSYYSDIAAEHDAITTRCGSHARTRANIAEAIRRGIPLRAGIISVSAGQRVDQARADLQAMGVTRIGTDYLRHVGRGARTIEPDMSQLCGNCGRGMAAISPDGDVWPCVFSRWMTVGNALTTPLAEILASQAMRDAVAMIPARAEVGPCKPDSNGNDCRPAEHATARARRAGPCTPITGGGCKPAQDGQCAPRPCR